MKKKIDKKLNRIGKRLQLPLSIWKLPLSMFRAGNIVMFHIGRSGSTVLANLLNQHPKIFWDGEIYEKYINGWKNQELVKRGCRLSPHPISLLRRRMILAGQNFYGFEVKFFHIKASHLELSDYIEQIQNLGFGNFIVLERRNYLRKIVSSSIAHNVTKKFHQSADQSASLNRIEIDVDNICIDRDSKPLLAYLQDYQERFCRLKALLADRRVLWLTYEDDISADPLIAYRSICKFLDIDEFPVSIKNSKINPFPLSEIITNFEEVEDKLRGTPFEWMLYE